MKNLYFIFAVLGLSLVSAFPIAAQNNNSTIQNNSNTPNNSSGGRHYKNEAKEKNNYNAPNRANDKEESNKTLDIMEDKQESLIETTFERYNNILPEEKTYIHTDRTLYSPNEIIYFKAYIQNQSNAPSSKSSDVYAHLLDGKGSTLQKIKIQNINGTATGDFSLDANTAGGLYKIRLYTHWQQNFSEQDYFEKTITVQKVVLPKLLMKLKFEREAYAAESRVTANLNVRSIDNKPLMYKQLHYTVFLAGKKVDKLQTVTDREGNALIDFQLPKNLTNSDGLVNIEINHEGNNESISRSIPIIINKIAVLFFPEGGNLIANTNNRVAFKALNEYGKPADIRGKLIDEQGNELATIQSYHQGMGAFEFTPQVGKKYHVQIQEPAITKKAYLPAAIAHGVAMKVLHNDKNKVQLQIFASRPQPLQVVVQLNGTIVEHRQLLSNEPIQQIELNSQQWAIGIAQITVFDAQNRPHAERLVFVNKHRQIYLDIKPDKQNYLPRQQINLDITALDEAGKPVQGNFSLAAVDDNNFTFIDDKQDNILSQFLMSSQLTGDIYEPNFYFKPEEPKADTALDYVLLTNGWRRFTWADVLSADTLKLQAQVRYDEQQNYIEGQATFDGDVFNNSKIYLLQNADDNVKNALQVTKTDKHGNFSFKNVQAKLPVYLKVDYRDWKANQQVSYWSAQVPNGNAPIISNPNNTHASKPSNIIVPRRDEWVNSNGAVVIEGTLFDQNIGEPLPFAVVVLKQNDRVVAGTTSDIDGNYKIANAPVGSYTLETSYIGYQSIKINNVLVEANRTHILDLNLKESDISLQEVVIVSTTKSEAKDNANEKQMERAKALAENLAKQDMEADLKTRKAKKEANFKEKEADSLNDELAKDTKPTTTTQKIDVADNKTSIDPNKTVTTSTIADNTSKVTANDGTTPVVVAGGTGDFTFQWTTGENDMLLANKNALRVDDAIFKVSGVTIMDEVVVSGSSVSLEMSNNMALSTIYYSPANGTYILQMNIGYINTERYIYIAQKNPIYNTEYYNARQYGGVYYPNIVANYTNQQRNDFRQTLHWMPNVTTDDKGKAKCAFYASDAITTVRIIAEGVSNKQLVGRKEQTFSVQKPFYISTKLPKVLSFGDTVLLNVIVKNNTDQDQQGKLSIPAMTALRLIDTSIFAQQYTIPANSFKQIVVALTVLPKLKTETINIAFNALGMRDEIRDNIVIVAKGFPKTASLAGKQRNSSLKFNISDIVPSSLTAEFTAYTSIWETLLASVERIIREPHGCFEQITSSNYPNVLALQLLEATKTINPTVRQKALTYLEKGYKGLEAYETTSKGFALFGGAVGDVRYSAYAIVQFTDMQKVYTGVNSEVIKRTQRWLMEREDKDGNFIGINAHQNYYGQNQDFQNALNAYAVYALSVVNEKDIDKALTKATNTAEKNKDMYQLAIVTLAHFNLNRTDKAEELLQLLIKQMDFKKLENSTAYNTLYSSGIGAATELNALAAIALMRSKHNQTQYIEPIITFLFTRGNTGYFGNTQATTLALKALCMYVEKTPITNGKGNIELYVNNILAATVPYATENYNPRINLPNLQEFFLPNGDNKVEVKFTGDESTIPFHFDVNWHTLAPQTNNDCAFKIKTDWQNSTARVGDLVRLNITLQNTKSTLIESPIASVIIPAGLSLQPWQLKEMVDKKLVHYYEIKDNTLHLYYTELMPNEIKTLNLDLKADIAGSYLTPASSAYLYYQNEVKDWTTSQILVIK